MYLRLAALKESASGLGSFEGAPDPRQPRKARWAAYDNTLRATQMKGEGAGKPAPNAFDCRFSKIPIEKIAPVGEGK